MPAIICEPIVSQEQWHSLRAENVGCSEVGALFGCHEYVTGYGLAARKMGKLPDTIDDTVLRRGRYLEPVAKRLLEEEKPKWRQIAATSYYYDPKIHFGATPDLFVEGEAGGLGIVQIKTVAPQIFASKWHNSEGNIEPPLWIAMQAMGEQHLTGADFAVIAALVVGYGISLELIEVPYMPGVVNEMRERVQAFWKQVATGELPEPDYGTDHAALQAVLRDDDGSEIDLTGDNEIPEIVSQFEAARQSKKLADTLMTECKDKLLHRIGPAQTAKYSGGIIKAKTVLRSAYTVPAGSYRQVLVKPERAQAVR